MGLFITVEGVEGSGKSTLALRLSEWMQQHEYPIFTTREPGGTTVGEALRQIILNAEIPACVETELLLIEAARAQLIHEVILPKLTHHHVILDRHIDSTTAYQGYGRGVELAVIQKLNQFTCHNRKPDLTFLLDITAEKGLQRVARMKKTEVNVDRFESEKIDFMRAVRDGFLAIAEKEPNRFAVLDGENDEDTVFEEALAVLRQHLNASK
jgi:dTMP kinase